VNTIKSLGAAFAGVLVVVVLSTVTDVALLAGGVFPPLGQPMTDLLCLLATAYRTLYGVAGGFVTARLAPHRPMAHALTIGAVGFLICLAGVVATWNRMSEFGPAWYPLALAALALPQSWAGAKLHEMQSKH
jgi:hypothetical protein